MVACVYLSYGSLLFVCGGFFSDCACGKKQYAVDAPAVCLGDGCILNNLIQSFHVLLFRLEEKANQ
jgi:hypothetical protein